jgi:hypothetical protein
MLSQGLDAMGGNGEHPGKSRLTLDHVLGRLQGELQKSCDTGAKFENLAGTMNDIHDTLGGFLVSDYKNITLLLI